MEAVFYNSKQKSQKREFILACANFFIKELGIKNSRKQVFFVSKKEADFDVSECYGATTTTEDAIWVYINPNLSVETTLHTVAHEMIHVAQFARGHLVKWVDENDQTVTTWCGKRYDETEYLELPWEIKAYEGQDRLAYKLTQILCS